MGASAILNEAAHGALMWVDEDYHEHFVKLVSSVIAATDVHKVLRADDQGWCIAPADPEVDGKDRDGLILCLPDRAVIAWFTGVLRIKSFRVEVPYSSITGTEAGTRPATTVQRERQTLTISAEQTWQLTFPAIYEADMSRLRSMIDGMVIGAVKPLYEDEENE